MGLRGLGGGQSSSRFVEVCERGSMTGGGEKSKTIVLLGGREMLRIA